MVEQSAHRTHRLSAVSVGGDPRVAPQLRRGLDAEKHLGADRVHQRAQWQLAFARQ